MLAFEKGRSKAGKFPGGVGRVTKIDQIADQTDFARHIRRR